jgi:hypothetical protein
MSQLMTDDYGTFLKNKSQDDVYSGFNPLWMPDFLFEFQKTLVDWSIRKGKAAIFADCGLGKTPMQLVWAENVVRKSNRPVLIITPLGVSAQTVREGEKFGIEVHRSKEGKIRPGINLTNYQSLHHFNPDDFVGVVCDESSILKSFDAKYRKEITEFMRKLPYRLLCTATAAPNDYIELGTSSEALGQLGHMDMLNRFFKNDQSTSDTKGHWRRFHAPREFDQKNWRFKGHAEEPFWKWVCSWARAIRKPSDLGFDDDGFILPPLVEQDYLVIAKKLANGFLFPLPAIGLKEQRDERRRTIQERCEKVAELVNGTGKQALVWGHMNDECDLLEQIIPDAKQVSGDDSDESKEERFLAFASGKLRVMVTKPKIGAWGLNFQNCSHVTFFPSHSYEQYYQGVRRCWRYGQTQPVKVDVVTTEGELDVLKNLQRKSVAADAMFENLVTYMQHSISIDRGIKFSQKEVIPSWLS